MQSKSWKIALTGAALVSAGAWSCQKNGSSPDAVSSQPPTQTQTWETQSPGGQQAPGMQQPGAQQPGGQQAPGMQQPGGQPPDSAQSGQGMQPSERSFERSPVAGQQPPMGSCPMAIEGTEVEASNTQAGVALQFTTREGNVADLRQRVNNLAQMYLTKAGRGQPQWFPARGQRGGQGGMGDGRGAGAGMQPGAGAGMQPGAGAGMGQFPPTTATVSELPDGAQIELQPTTPQALSELRDQVRLHAERLNSGQCWMSSPASDASSQPERGLQGSQSPNEPGR